MSSTGNDTRALRERNLPDGPVVVARVVVVNGSAVVVVIGSVVTVVVIGSVVTVIDVTVEFIHS